VSPVTTPEENLGLALISRGAILVMCCGEASVICGFVTLSVIYLWFVRVSRLLGWERPSEWGLQS
jgi:hypothetical protein